MANESTESTESTKSAGKVYLVGAGPGAVDLLTVRAARLLASADVLFYDALVDPEVIALAAKAQKIAVGKRCGQHSSAQRFINKRLVDAAKAQGAQGFVVRLKGGDPMLFGRAQEEIDALAAAGIAYEVVPGVTAALAASADLGISLTRRGVSRSVVFATPRVGKDENPSDWIAGVLAADTAVLYMAAGEAGEIATQLMSRGKPADLPVAIVRDASSPRFESKLTTLAGLAAGIDRDERPVLVCIGEVYREALIARSIAADEHERLWPIAAARRCRNGS